MVPNVGNGSVVGVFDGGILRENTIRRTNGTILVALWFVAIAGSHLESTGLSKNKKKNCDVPRELKNLVFKYDIGVPKS